MIVRFLDTNNLETYTDTENIAALNSFKNNCYDVRYRVILKTQNQIIVSKETFDKLVKLFYNNIGMKIE